MVIEKTKRIKKGLMRILFTRGLGHKEYKDTEIGKIPKTWKIARIQDIIVKTIGGGTPSTKNPRYWNGNIPWITSVGIPEDSIYISKGERFITEEGLKNSTSNIVPKQNVIVATRVGLGKAGVNVIDIAINQDLTGLVVNKEYIVPEYLAYYLRTPRIVRFIMSAARGTTIKGITQKTLLSIKMPLPSPEEQKRIVKILMIIDEKLRLESQRRERLVRIKKGLMDLLLTGRIRIRVN